MFDQIQLFTKTGNKVQEPDPSWTDKTTIHCSLDLNLGFGTEKVVWGKGNSLKLKKLISYFVELSRFTTSFDPSEISFEFRNNDAAYVFTWTKEENAGILVKVHQKRYNSTKFILQKTFNRIQILEFKSEFIITVVGILSEKTNNEVATAIGELFFDSQSQIRYEFSIGQRVKTIVGQNVKTERTGVVISKAYHQKDQTTMYRLLINGKIAAKRYFPVDLKRIE